MASRTGPASFRTDNAVSAGGTGGTEATPWGGALDPSAGGATAVASRPIMTVPVAATPATSAATAATNFSLDSSMALRTPCDSMTILAEDATAAASPTAMFTVLRNKEGGTGTGT